MKQALCAVGFAALMTWAVSAAAQLTPDHLKCYKVKDPQAKTTYTADLGGLVAEPGCTIKVPAITACVPATKTNVSPTPPGGGGSGTPNSFFCYKVKCPKATLPTLTGTDQFGSRTVTPSAAKIVCAPLAGPPCSAPGPIGSPSCSGDCPPGLFCSIDLHSGICSCVPGEAPCNDHSCGSACPSGEQCMVFGSGPGGLVCGCG